MLSAVFTWGRWVPPGAGGSGGRDGLGPGQAGTACPLPGGMAAVRVPPWTPGCQGEILLSSSVPPPLLMLQDVLGSVWRTCRASSCSSCGWVTPPL